MEIMDQCGLPRDRFFFVTNRIPRVVNRLGALEEAGKLMRVLGNKECRIPSNS